MATAPKMPTPGDYRDCLAQTPRTVATTAGPVEYATRGDGEQVFAIHGTLGGWDQGLVGAELFRVNGFRIIAPSRPGYLGTPLSTGRTFAEQGDAHAALLDALGIDRILVFAASGGGPSAYELAARHPDRVNALVQLDSVCIPGKIPSGLAQITAGDATAKLQLWALRHMTRQALSLLLRGAGTYDRTEASKLAAQLVSRPGSTEALEATLRASLGGRRRRPGMRNDFVVFTPAPLEQITSPTLIVHGTRDKIVPPASAEYAHAHIAGSELHWIDGSHVAIALEAADTAPTFIIDWLTAHS